MAVRRLEDGDTASDVLAEFLGLLEHFEFDVKAVYLDSGFYDGKCLTLLQVHNFAYIVPVISWGKEIKRELATGWSREIARYGNREQVYRRLGRIFPEFDAGLRSITRETNPDGNR